MNGLFQGVSARFGLERISLILSPIDQFKKTLVAEPCEARTSKKLYSRATPNADLLVERSDEESEGEALEIQSAAGATSKRGLL